MAKKSFKSKPHLPLLYRIRYFLNDMQCYISVFRFGRTAADSLAKDLAAVDNITQIKVTKISITLTEAQERYKAESPGAT